jgi:hypothetical protein
MGAPPARAEAADARSRRRMAALVAQYVQDLSREAKEAPR